MAVEFSDRLADFARDPGLVLHQLDPVERRALLLDLGLARIRAASFLDERAFAGQRPAGGWLAAEDWLARAAALPPAAPHAIFHIGHCGSTLVSRALDRLPAVFGLREPLPLRTLAELLPGLDQPASRLDRATWQRWLEATLAGLARRPSGVRVVIVKASSNCNGLIEPWLGHDAAARALLLYVPLRPWLATLLKSPPAVRDALTFAPARLDALTAALGDAPFRLAALARVEQLTLGWLAELERFTRLASGPLAPRLGLLDFEAFLATPHELLGAIAGALGLTPDAATLAAALDAATLGRYAKAPEHPYSRADREADLAESTRRHAAEIEAGIDFARAAIAQHAPLARLAPRLDRIAP